MEDVHSGIGSLRILTVLAAMVIIIAAVVVVACDDPSTTGPWAPVHPSSCLVGKGAATSCR